MPESDVPDSPFQSTPPCAGGDQANALYAGHSDISIHAPLCGGRHCNKCGNIFQSWISIHAPLCGGRHGRRVCLLAMTRFQSTPPCAGGDCSAAPVLPWPPYFNPRPPVRGATGIFRAMRAYPLFQSTPPCAGGDCASALIFFAKSISIHAPLCGGRPLISPHLKRGQMYFNPRPPVRGATLICGQPF